MSVGLLLIAAALVLTGKNLYEEQDGAAQSASALEVVQAQIRARLADSLGEDPENPGLTEDGGTDGEVSIRRRPEWRAATIPDYQLNPEMQMPEVKVLGDGYIGVLSIPALGLELPVMSEWNYPNLRKAPCRYVGSAYLDNLVICAHNYDRHFGRIKSLAIGDKVVFTDTDGNVFNYHVAEQEILRPYASAEMKTGWDLTLFTCTIGGRTRVTVRCEKDE